MNKIIRKIAPLRSSTYRQLRFHLWKRMRNNKVVYKVPVADEVEKGLYAFLQRSFAEAENAGADSNHS